MSKSIHFVAASGLGLLAAAFAANTMSASAGTANASSDVSCEIGAVKAGGGVELQGLARGQRKLALDYRLTIRAGSHGNSSDIVQSGQATVLPGQNAVIGTASISGVGDYIATLTVTWPGGQTTCKRSGSA